MALIYCSECGKQVSDHAASCPHCGNPVQRTQAGDSETQPFYVEPVLVSKKWKKRKLYGLGFSLLGLFMAWIGFVQVINGNEWGGAVGGIGVLIFIGGFITLLIAGIGSWYENRQIG
jgi:endogenous inhibitor of DNA gyrase (YacG/DUF329 family)